MSDKNEKILQEMGNGNQPEALAGQEKEDSFSEKSKDEKDLEKHLLSTTRVGLPGQEKLVGFSINQDQLAVRTLRPDDIFDLQEKIIGPLKTELSTIINNEKLTVDDRLALADGVNEKIKIQSEHLVEFYRALSEHESQILVIDPNSINKDKFNISFKGDFLLASKDAVIKIGKKLKGFGYREEKINKTGDDNNGLVYTYGDQRITFIFGKEKSEIEKSKS
jgi:hypothetical protein